MIIVLLIAISLSLDSFATAIGLGLKSKNNVSKTAFIASIIFAFCQSLLLFLGYIAGRGLESIISSIDHWIAFILLSIVGVKFIIEAFDKKEEHAIKKINLKTLFLLGVATSIDAFIIGITFISMDITIVNGVIATGGITFLLSLAGFLLGKKVSQMKSERIEALGGVILIIIGFKILLSHLF